MGSDILLEVKGIKKSFGATKALRGVDFTLRKGEVHALVGENGAGKSTLMNVIGGVISADAGEIFVKGNKVRIRDPYEAQVLGIGIVHQEIALCPDVTVAENIFMPGINRSKKVTVNYKALYKRANELLAPLAKIDSRKTVGSLPVSSQQVVEIARALSMNCEILILDEPTAALTESETEALFKIMRDLKAKGIGIIYISHRMAEIFAECDQVTILRDGTLVDTLKVSETDSKTVVNKMVGRHIGDLYPPKKDPEEQLKGEYIFEAIGFSDGDRFNDISLKVREGEILGIAGLVGAGRSEVAQAVCGLRPKLAGDVYYRGKKLTIRNAKDSINNGIVYLTEDRKEVGLFLEQSIKYNISAMKLENISNSGFLNKKAERLQACEFAEKLQVKCESIEKPITSLSGGNQQKVLLSKLLTTKPKVIFMDEPTRGIDVGAKSEIHKLLRELANQGTGIIMISSELPEVVGMCDRVIVMHEGKVSGEVSSEEINERRIIQLASGINE